MAKEPSISSLAQRLDRVRELRTRPDADLSMRFLKKQFSQQVAQPHKQLSAFAQAWRASLPAALVEQTRLESLSRGVLRVSVTSSAHLFEIDRLLRSGLEQRILGASRGSTVRRIALVVATPSRPHGNYDEPRRHSMSDAVSDAARAQQTNNTIALGSLSPGPVL